LGVISCGNEPLLRNADFFYNIEGIPRSFLYDREGKVLAEAVDMRARQQIMEMLGQAGLK
jgi:hypothetical protein